MDREIRVLVFAPETTVRQLIDEALSLKTAIQPIWAETKQAVSGRLRSDPYIECVIIAYDSNDSISPDLPREVTSIRSEIPIIRGAGEPRKAGTTVGPYDAFWDWSATAADRSLITSIELLVGDRLDNKNAAPPA
ncbi:hypothetical protein HUB97_04095 [Halorubraceae archaeon YAN]|nr:hypothetical protein [Halorubraceae archaeon YAN]